MKNGKGDDARDAYLSEAAHLYYDLGKKQSEVAKVMGITRSGVSRLLTEARRRGIVEIVVHSPSNTSKELEDALAGLFGLKDVRVLIRRGKDDGEMLSELGVAAARYFLGILEDGHMIGISWGTALRHMLDALRSSPSGTFANSKVVQLIGGTGAEHASVVGPLLAPMLANKLGCSCHYLHAPLIMEHEHSRKTILMERSIRETMELGRSADIALVGIGSTRQEIYNPLRLGYVSEREMSDILAAGGVGLVCGRHYSLDGAELKTGLNERVIGITLSSLADIPWVIGVAGGEIKGESILGALLGRYVNVLITDDVAARRVLEIHRQITSASRPVL